MLRSVISLSGLLFLAIACKKEEVTQTPALWEVVVKDKITSSPLADASVTFYVRDNDGASWAQYTTTDANGLAKAEADGYLEELRVEKNGYYGYCKNQFISPVILDAIAHLKVHFKNDTPAFHSDLIEFYFPGDYFCYESSIVKSGLLTGINDTTLIIKTIAGNQLLRWKVTSGSNSQVYSEYSFPIAKHDTTEFEIIY